MKRLIMTMTMLLGLLAFNVYAADNTASAGSSDSLGEKNMQMGEAFLKANKAKADVKILPDGLQYKILEEGTGPSPKASDVVVVDYAGRFINGKEFDSSYQRGVPATFPVTGVIPGWVEALQLMKVGATWELYVPSDLAYGERGMPPVIGPNETLIFKVKLIDIKNS